MKHSSRLVVIVTVFVALCHSFPATAQTNLVRNGGFEQLDAPGLPAAWSGWNDAWKPDAAITHSGSHSAHFVNTDPSRYLLLSQKIPATPDHRFRLTCWIKTDGIVGEDSGATACIEWSDRAGKYLGGFYPTGFKGTNDWKRLSDVSPRIPREAAAVNVTVYVRKGMTGAAWFDDVDVVEEADPPFEGSIRIPGYREVVTGGRSSAPLTVSGLLGLDDQHPLTDRTLVASIYPASGSKALVSRRITAPTTTQVELSIPTSELHNGAYRAVFDVYAKGIEKPLAERSASFVKAARNRMIGVAFSPNGMALVDGTPFFPIGVYEGISPSEPASLEHLKEIADAGFNCVLNYGICGGKLSDIRRYLDRAQELGLKVIFSIKDVYEGSTYPVAQVENWKGDEQIVRGLVTAFRSHPALLAWYLNDELSLTWHDKLVRNYRWLRDLDANHPGYIVLYQFNELDGYNDTTDVMGVDPYPIPNSPVTMVSTWTDAAVKLGKPAWIVPQIFDWSVYNKNEKPAPPTLAEMRCMLHLALLHGAAGSLIKTGSVETREWKMGRQTLLLVVNTDRKPAAAHVKLPAGVKSVAPLGGGAPLSVENGAVDVQLEPLETRMWKVAN